MMKDCEGCVNRYLDIAVENDKCGQCSRTFYDQYRAHEQTTHGKINLKLSRLARRLDRLITLGMTR